MNPKWLLALILITGCKGNPSTAKQPASPDTLLLAKAGIPAIDTLIQPAKIQRDTIRDRDVFFADLNDDNVADTITLGYPSQKKGIF